MYNYGGRSGWNFEEIEKLVGRDVLLDSKNKEYARELFHSNSKLSYDDISKLIKILRGEVYYKFTRTHSDIIVCDMSPNLRSNYSVVCILVQEEVCSPFYVEMLISKGYGFVITEKLIELSKLKTLNNICHSNKGKFGKKAVSKLRHYIAVKHMSFSVKSAIIAESVGRKQLQPFLDLNERALNLQIASMEIINNFDILKELSKSRVSTVSYRARQTLRNMDNIAKGDFFYRVKLKLVRRKYEKN